MDDVNKNAAVATLLDSFSVLAYSVGMFPTIEALRDTLVTSWQGSVQLEQVSVSGFLVFNELDGPSVVKSGNLELTYTSPPQSVVNPVLLRGALEDVVHKVNELIQSHNKLLELVNLHHSVTETLLT